METKANENKECEFFLAKKENGCKRHPVVDPETDKLLGFVACRVFDKCPLKNKKEIFATAEQAKSVLYGRVEMPPSPLQVDEVAHAFFNSSRVESWEVLGEEYAGHKIGAIYSFVLGLIEKHIGESMCIKSEQIISKEEV